MLQSQGKAGLAVFRGDGHPGKKEQRKKPEDIPEHGQRRPLLLQGCPWRKNQ